MEIRVTRPFIVSFITGDQYGGPGCFDNHAYMHCFTEINQIKYSTVGLLHVLFQCHINIFLDLIILSQKRLIAFI